MKGSSSEPRCSPEDGNRCVQKALSSALVGGCSLQVGERRTSCSHRYYGGCFKHFSLFHYLPGTSIEQEPSQVAWIENCDCGVCTSFALMAVLLPT